MYWQTGKDAERNDNRNAIGPELMMSRRESTPGRLIALAGLAQN
jgi:hypothetical protein